MDDCGGYFQHGHDAADAGTNADEEKVNSGNTKTLSSLKDLTRLIVETGIYRYIRHPLYASLVLLGFGIFFKNITWMTAVCAVINLLALAATAKTEEGEMLQKFGDGYARYRKKRKMFIPFVV